jgi:hypothetical protein
MKIQIADLSKPAKVNLFLATLALTLSFSAFASDLPNPSLAPGAINPEITQQNIQQTVYVKGYTKTIRPPASYTNNIKRQQLRKLPTVVLTRHLRQQLANAEAATR